jgi:toxin ParE1/3/4
MNCQHLLACAARLTKRVPRRVEIVWSPLALKRLQEIRAFVAQDKPDAAAKLATRIVAIVEALRNHPHLGRTGVEARVRELILGGTPYIIVYRIQKNTVIISTILHAAQHRH